MRWIPSTPGKAIAFTWRPSTPWRLVGGSLFPPARIRKPEFDQIAGAHTPVTDLYREDLGNRYPAFLKKPDATGYMWDSLAAAYLLDPEFVTRSESRYLDVLTTWGQFYGSTVPLD